MARNILIFPSVFSLSLSLSLLICLFSSLFYFFSFVSSFPNFSNCSFRMDYCHIFIFISLSISKSFSIIPICKTRKLLNFLASFQFVSLTFCFLKMFARIILYRLLFFGIQLHSFSPFGRFQPRSVYSISNSLSALINFGWVLKTHKSGSPTILAAINFSSAFGSVWYNPFSHNLVSFGSPSCFQWWTQSFLSDRHTCMLFQNHKSRRFSVRQGIPQKFLYDFFLFLFFINFLPTSFYSSVATLFMLST